MFVGRSNYDNTVRAVCRSWAVATTATVVRGPWQLQQLTVRGLFVIYLPAGGVGITAANNFTQSPD